MTRIFPYLLYCEASSTGRHIALALAVLGCALPFQETRAQTPAGVAVENTATLAYALAGGSRLANSNPDRLIVAELLDVTLAPSGTLGVVLTNPGNGTEAYDVLSAVTDAAVRRIVIDRNNDGRIDDGDPPLNARTPVLASGGAITLLIEADIAGPAPSITITARAATGSGTPGTNIERGGDNGGDAVVGVTGAAATLTLTPAPLSTPTLTKHQDVRAPDGSGQAIPGAVITYTLEAAFPSGNGEARIDDDVPAGTRFVPGSVKLDGVALTDLEDADPGVATATRITVTLAGLVAGARHIVSFQAIIL